MHWKTTLLITIIIAAGIALLQWVTLQPALLNPLAAGIGFLAPLLALYWIITSMLAVENWRDRLSWSFIGVSVLAFSTYWFTTHAVGRPLYGSPAADVLFLSSFVFLWAGMLVRRGQFPSELLGRLIMLLDILISVGAAIAITLQLPFSTLTFVPEYAPLLKLNGLAYPLLALGTLICINLLLLRITPRQENAANALMVLGVGLQLAGGMWSVYLALGGMQEVPFLCQSLWPVGFLLYGVAARLEASLQHRMLRIDHRVDPFPSIAGLLVSVALVLAALVLALLTLVDPRTPLEPRQLIYAFFSLAGLITLALIRQVLTFESNRHLYTSLQYLYGEMAQNAATDPLTGLANHGYFMERLDQEMHRARRYHHQLAIIFADLDFFKQVNDTYGHHAGDLALQKVARTLEHSVRDVDLVGRYGGEEFVVLLPETSLENAALLAERLRFNVGLIQLPFLEKDGRRLTLSCGVAAYPETSDSCDALLRCADEAMYRAKSAGRDRVMVANTLTTPVH
ncbi:MAG: GGDEF domain-containing protein [Armatimonadota bacterium]